MLLRFIGPGPIERILVSAGVKGNIWPAVVTSGSEESSVGIQVLDCLLPLVVCLRIVVFSHEDYAVVESRWRLGE